MSFRKLRTVNTKLLGRSPEMSGGAGPGGAFDPDGLEGVRLFSTLRRQASSKRKEKRSQDVLFDNSTTSLESNMQ